MIQKHYELHHFPRVSSLEIEGETFFFFFFLNSPHLLPVKLHNPALSRVQRSVADEALGDSSGFFFLFDTVAL